MKQLTKRERDILANIDPRCEDCEHYREHRGSMMCHYASPFLAYTHTQRRTKPKRSMNCGAEGNNFVMAFHEEDK